LTHKIKGRSDLILYGGRSSGKTTLAKKVLNNFLGVGNYIDVNVIFAHSRDAFLYLVGESFFTFIKSLDSRFADMVG
jgi:AAA+ ATPase superfamily predicted ATPase